MSLGALTSGTLQVAQITTDELIRADEAFAGNRLLSTFSSEARALIEPYGEVVELNTGDVVLNRGDQVRSSLFPIGPTMISLAVELSGGRTIEVASIGLRGAVGGIISCGQAPAFSHATVLVPGRAFKVPMEALEEAKHRNCGRVEWTVLDWNQLAIDFYQKIGGEHIKEWQLYRLVL